MIEGILENTKTCPEETILTLQEFIGYSVIPTTRAQAMIMIIGNGGEGKSRIGVVLSRILAEI